MYVHGWMDNYDMLYCIASQDENCVLKVKIVIY